MAEQFRFDQIRWNGAAVDRDEGTTRPAAPLMDRPRDKLFAAARLAGHEHRRFGRRNLVDHPIDVLHRRRAAVQPTEASERGRRCRARRSEKWQCHDVGNVDRGIVQIHKVLRFLSCR